MKICCTCKRELPYTSFSIKKGDKLQGNCKDCNRKYNKNHYITNKEIYKEKAKKWDEKNYSSNLKKLLDYLLEHPCIDCGETDPVVLEFDHIRDKTKNVSALLQEATWATVLKEINKCEVRCANCHRRKTAKQFGHKKLLVWFNNDY